MNYISIFLALPNMIATEYKFDEFGFPVCTENWSKVWSVVEEETGPPECSKSADLDNFLDFNFTLDDSFEPEVRLNSVIRRYYFFQRAQIFQKCSYGNR